MGRKVHFSVYSSFITPSFGITVVVFRELSVSTSLSLRQHGKPKHLNICTEKQMSAQHERAIMSFYLIQTLFESQLWFPSLQWTLYCTINALYWDILLLSDQNQHHVSKGQIIDVDLSKLSNLGTYQEIGKGYGETATERNLQAKYFLVWCLTVNKGLSKI